MGAVPAKAKSKAERPAGAGLRPRTEDRKSQPWNATAGEEWETVKPDARIQGEDRARLAPGLASHGRYGNSEVGRVAALRDPALLDARRGAFGTLPETGVVAAKRAGDARLAKKVAMPAAAYPETAKPKAEGKDKKGDTESEGEADAAEGKTDAKDKDGKKKEKKKGGEKEVADKGKGAPAAEDADGEGKGKKEKGAAEGDDAGGEMAEGEVPAAAVGAGEGFETKTLEPPRPRLEGTQAAVVSPPPLNAQQLERIRSQTGVTAAEHYARVQVHLDRLSARAQSEQFAIVLHIELIEAEVRRDLENASALIAPSVRGAIDMVRSACATARAGISTASQDALATIEKHATDADRKVDVAALTSKEAVETAVLATSPQVRGLYEETMAPLRTLLAKTAEKFKEVGQTQGGAMVTKAADIGGKLAKKGGDAIQIAEDEKRAQLAADQAQVAARDLEQAGERGATDILGQETTLGMSFLLLVNPVAVKVEQVGAADASEATSKGGEARLRLTTDYERARGFVEETTKRALKALDAMEGAAVEQLEQLGPQLEEMARTRRERLCNAILEGQAPAAEAWAREMARVNQLVPAGEVVDWRRLEPRFVEAMDSMNALSARQRLDFDAQARTGFDEARAGMVEDRGSIDEAAEAYVSGARATRTQATAMRQVAATFADGFRGVAHSASSSVSEFRAKAEEKLGLSVEDARKQMGKLLAETTVSLDDSVKKFDTTLGDQVKGLEASLAPTFRQVAVDVPLNLADRAGRAFRAMDRVGTEETDLFEALYGMTPKYAAALEEYWKRADHAHDLWWWLKDELSGDEYMTAYWYLKGDPVKGARFELSASIHWYGDDVKQMESALRALSSEQLKALNNDPAFAEVKAKLQGSLKGTNLDVTNALLAGRTARADALRLKEQIDAARAAGDDDKLHDALAKVDPNRLPEVRREFADVLAGKAMSEKPPDIDDKKAAEAFTTYVTKPVEVYEPGDPEGGGGRMRTVTLSEPSKKLAEALATTGEGSAESRAARLAYETTRGGKPRPERLAKALDDPELVAARANPILTKPDADPRDVARAKEALDTLEARRADMLQKFAELRGADKATREDPARAREFTENAVAGMFGNDKLGRELGTSMVRDGRANPAVAIKFAVRGWGTNEELIRQTLRGMSAAEIADLKKEYSDRFDRDNPNKLFDDLGVFQNADTAKAAGVDHATEGGFFTELSGDERQEVEELLLGTPKNDRDRMRLARLKYQHQKGEGTTWLGSVLMPAAADAVVPRLGEVAKGATTESVSGRSLDMNKARMEEMIAAVPGGEAEAFDEDGNFKGVPGRFSVTDFRIHTAATSEMAENYKHHIDSLADMITGAIAIIGAIVGTIVVTVLTMGTATPLVIGLWAAGIAAATGAAAMATNYALKGSRYGWEQAAVDGALTLLDAATAGLMAGAGAKAARAATQMAAITAAARTPAQVAAAATATRQAERHAEKELARGFVRAAAGSGVSGTARTATADGTWDEGFMSGLGKSVSGGVKAAVIGVATHGASTSFSKLGIGEKLGKSTSYLARGTGAGLSGAFGGMAGRSSELTLDALGGHEQGTWYDAMGSIALAGGRGFAENFGQGMAEVPKARRDEAQAHLDRLRGKADAERVARYGPGPEDEAADLRFRRMAVAAARLDDPRTNLKAFLADLDTGVASDRALAETHHRLVRDFRREALAGIPPERRGEFADVPIHVLPDAEFERFTGSLSGRAVTIIVDGEAQIVVRKSATPEVMREEGIHALQSRDPRWRDRIARLDESTLSRWNELDLETQFSLYREKLEIEIDAQRRLRADLLAEAERTPDPARRAALRARADETEATHSALLARRDEVDDIGPDRRAAIRGGQEARPQYLREPARLFSKKQVVFDELNPEKTPKRDEPLEHSSELGAEPRRPVALKNSTWGDDYPGHRLYQVGDAWTEEEGYRTPGGKADTRDRWYRMVEVTKVIDGVETVVDRRREILQIDGRWQQRGSESTAWGAILEKASRLRTLAETRAGLGREIRPNDDPIVPIGALLGVSGKPLSAQHHGGAGFDDVVFHFSKVEDRTVAHIVIIEAKGYRRSLTLEEFSAITANLPENLFRLGEAVSRSNLSEDRIAAVTSAIRERNISFEVHTSPTTGLGHIAGTRSSILRDIVGTAEAWRQLAVAQEHLAKRIRTEPLDADEVERIRDDHAALTRLLTRLENAYATEPFQPDRVQSVLTAILEGTRDVRSVARIAARNGLDVEERRALILRTEIDPEGPDKPYIEAARQAHKDSWKNLERSTGFAIGLAEEVGLADRDFEPMATASNVPKDVAVVRNDDTNRSLAVTRPSVVAPATGTDSAASSQLVALLRDGVPLADGKIERPDHVLWDSAGANPAEVSLVLDQVRAALAPKATDAKRLRVMVDGAVATDKAALRKALSLPDGVHAERVIRTPHGSATWVLSIDAKWVAAGKRPRK